jgi:predicted secreted protein
MQHASPGDSVTLEVDEEFTVGLMSSPGTGHRWRLESTTPLVSGRMVGLQLHKRCGGLATEVWQFTAWRPGSVALRFVYGRPWEEEVMDRAGVVVRII